MLHYTVSIIYQHILPDANTFEIKADIAKDVPSGSILKRSVFDGITPELPKKKKNAKIKERLTSTEDDKNPSLLKNLTQFACCLMYFKFHKFSKNIVF